MHTVRLTNADAMMKRIGKGPQEGNRFTQAVGFAKIEHIAKERHCLRPARRGKNDVSKPLDFCVCGLKRIGWLLRGWQRKLQCGARIRFNHPSRSSQAALIAFDR